MDVLTASLEDYLEAIWVTGLEKKVVRVKDIVKCLNVSSASVVGAIKTLAQKGLVLHERYGYVEVTNEGASVAEKIYEKHKTLSKFFHEILGVDLKTAAKDACQIEHHIDKKTMERIVEFIRFIDTCPEGEPLWLSSFHYFAKHGERPEHCERRESMTEAGDVEGSSKLDKLKIGQEGRVLNITAGSGIKRRLLDMGIVPGVKVRIEKVAPLGDPIDIVVKGYHLSLRKEEASTVMVEVIE